MKKGHFKNPHIITDDHDRKLAEEIAGPVKLDLFRFLVILFIVLPVVYVLLVQTPGSWLPEQLPAKPDLSRNDNAAEKAEVNSFAVLDSAIIKASNQPSFQNYFNLSFEFYKAGKYKESITAAEKALEFNPRSAEAYNNICSAYNELKDYAKAKKACESALDINPEFQLAKNNLAWSVKQLAN